MEREFVHHQLVVLISGGQYSGTPAANTIEFVTISTTGNAVDFGDLSIQVHRDHGSGGNSTRGIFDGGSGNSDQRTNVIDFITIATLGNQLILVIILRQIKRVNVQAHHHQLAW